MRICARSENRIDLILRVHQHLAKLLEVFVFLGIGCLVLAGHGWRFWSTVVLHWVYKLVSLHRTTLRLHAADLLSLWSADLDLLWLSLHFDRAGSVAANDALDVFCSLRDGAAAKPLVHLLLLLVLLLDHAIGEWERRGRWLLLGRRLVANDCCGWVCLRISGERRSRWCRWSVEACGRGWWILRERSGELRRLRLLLVRIGRIRLEI